MIAEGRIDRTDDHEHSGGKFTMYISVDGTTEQAYETDRETSNFKSFVRQFTFWPTHSVKIRITKFEYRYGDGDWRFFDLEESITLFVGLLQ